MVTDPAKGHIRFLDYARNDRKETIDFIFIIAATKYKDHYYPNA